MFNWDKAIEIALRTWYPKSHNLHLNSHHPLGKLCGEWGELLDDYMKSIYKPGYRFEPEDELGDIWYYIRILCYQKDYDAVDFDLSERSTEYLIACAINETSRSFMDLMTHQKIPFWKLLREAISTLGRKLANNSHFQRLFNRFQGKFPTTTSNRVLLMTHLDYSVYSLDISYSVLCAIVNRYDLTLHDLTKSNWQKLKPGSERGEQWRKARLTV